MKSLCPRVWYGSASYAAVAISIMLVAGERARAQLVVNAPIDVIGNVSASDFTSNGYGTNTYKDWGNEPSVAFDPANTNDLFVSSFAYGSSPTQGADVFFSSNAGASWSSNYTITQPSPSVAIPNDWRFVFDGSGTLHGAVLGGCSSCNVYSGSSTNPNGAGWTWSGGGAQINTAASSGMGDQPWIALNPSNNNQIYIAYDASITVAAPRVVASSNGGTTFPVDQLVIQNPVSSSVNNGLRIATDGVGNVYSIWGVGSATGTNGVQNVTYYLNESKNGGKTWLFDTASNPNGLQIASGVSTQLCNPCTQASNNWFAGVNDLRGNVTDISSDNSGSHIYVTYGAQDGSGINRVYLEEFHPSGGTLVGSTPVVVSPAGQNAALPSLTVLADGDVVVEYETWNGSQVQAHVAASNNDGASIASNDLVYSFAPLTLLQATGSTTSNREFGDYVHVASVNNTFYGTFAGLGNVNSGGINTTGLIDPFVFTGSDTPGPDCTNECANTFNGQSSGAPAVSFSYVLKGDVRSQIDTALTASDPLVDAFAYVNQHYFGGSGLSTVGLSLDSNGNTVITYTGSHPILNTYTFNYGGGPGAPHFGFEGTPGAPLVNVSQYWTYGTGEEERTTLLPNLSVTTPLAVSGGNNYYAVFFAEVSIGSTLGGQWVESAFPIGTRPEFLLSNTTLFDEQLSDVGYLLSDTMIPLDDLNTGMTPPPGEPGSEFIDLSRLDGLILTPGESINVSVVPEPSTWAMMLIGFAGLGYIASRRILKPRLEASAA